MKQNHSFRLSLRTKESQTFVFQCSRAEFRSALASAYIDLRSLDRRSPLALDIGVVGKPMRWLPFPSQPGLDPGTLPNNVRWECSADIYDALVKLHEDTVMAKTPAAAGVD